MKAVLFDLDDTLYDEITYVRSGFNVVSREISRRFGLDCDRVYKRMCDLLESNGRGSVFDDVLEENKIQDPMLVSELVMIYREHKPEITLYEDVVPVLKSLRSMEQAVGLITDGHPTAQRRKVGALCLGDYMDTIVFSWDLGEDYSKPSPYPYITALNTLGVMGGEALYVGDNPTKDFDGAHSLRMASLHLVRSGGCKFPSCSAHYHGSDLGEVLKIVSALSQRSA